MSAGQVRDVDPFEEKMERIRKQNIILKLRYLEVEADKQKAAKEDALVNVTAPSVDWTSNRVMETLDRDDLEKSNNRASILSSTRKNHRMAIGRGTRAKLESSQGGMLDNTQSIKDRQDKWRKERDEIDKDRMSRQKTADGLWRREWDCKKSAEPEVSESFRRPFSAGNTRRRPDYNFCRTSGKPLSSSSTAGGCSPHPSQFGQHSTQASKKIEEQRGPLDLGRRHDRNFKYDDLTMQVSTNNDEHQRSAVLTAFQASKSRVNSKNSFEIYSRRTSDKIQGIATPCNMLKTNSDDWEDIDERSGSTDNKINVDKTSFGQQGIGASKNVVEGNSDAFQNHEKKRQSRAKNPIDSPQSIFKVMRTQKIIDKDCEAVFDM